MGFANSVQISCNSNVQLSLLCEVKKLIGYKSKKSNFLFFTQLTFTSHESRNCMVHLGYDYDPH